MYQQGASLYQQGGEFVRGRVDWHLYKRHILHIHVHCTLYPHVHVHDDRSCMHDELDYDVMTGTPFIMLSSHYPPAIIITSESTINLKYRRMVNVGITIKCGFMSVYSSPYKSRVEFNDI